MQQKNEAFLKACKRLNPAQKQAVDAIDGPVMVLAGPGTGKTQILATRIGKILAETDTQPQDILALTFTESAAQNMRERVVSLIGQAGYYVHITTFHSFCQSVISSHPEYFPIDRDSKSLSDLERYALFEQLIEQLPLDILRPLNRPLFYIKDIQTAISNLKKEGITPEAYQTLVLESFVEQEKMTKAAKMKMEKNRKKNEELSLIYKEYEKNLRNQLRYDYEDMIALTNQAFKEHELLLQEYQEQLLYFLVDEYQDTNSAQNSVVMQLSSHWKESANIFVVGDPHQAIYRFQGASVENVFGFLDEYPNAKVITLNKGYRCPQPLYAAAHSLILQNKLTTSSHESIKNSLIELESQTSVLQKPVVRAAPSQLAEVSFVARDISEKIKSGISPSDIAVLYRTNAESQSIQEAFEDWSIPYDLEGGRTIFSIEEIQQFLRLLRLIESLQSQSDMDELYEVGCFSWTKVDVTTVYKLGQQAFSQKISLLELLSQDYSNVKENSNLVTVVSEEKFEEFRAFIDQLQKWGIQNSQKTFVELFETILTESGYLEWISNHENKHELTLAINALFSEVKRLAHAEKNVTLSFFNQTILLMEEHSIAIVPEDLNIRGACVHLSTAHKAKGQEWDHVYVIHCHDGKWGNRRSIDLLPLPDSILQHTDISKKERNEDERRLFYVAVTRAKQTLTCTYPQTLVSENRSKKMLASMFLEELGDSVELSEIEISSKEEENYIEQLLSPQTKRHASLDEKDFFGELVKRFSLSVTALNTYLRSPEEFVQLSLLRKPQSKSPSLAFGTAMHTALEHVYVRRKENQNVLENEVIDVFGKALEQEILTEDEFKRRLSYGKEVITNYLKTVPWQEKTPLFTERLFGKGMSKTYLADIRLTGRIDRVDLIDKKNKLIRVVDYKTGAQKSENAIRGLSSIEGYSARELALPETIRGRYMRQLVFYALLSELDNSFPYQVEQAVFEFVEPQKSNGSVTTRQFTIQKEAVEDLKNLIKEVMSEIRSLSFLD